MSRSRGSSFRCGPFVFTLRLFPSIVALLLLAALLWLGFWQLDRAAEKAGVEARFERAGGEPELALTGSSTAATVPEYAKVVLSGAPEPVRQFLLDNRTHEGIAGYHVLTPVRLGAEAVLLNRGWVPVGETRAVLPDVSLAPEPVEVRGLAAPAPRSFVLGEDEGYAARGWPLVVQSVDFEEMERRLGYRLLRLVVLMDAKAPGGFIREWRPRRFSAQRHRGYALQWFSLALALVVLSLVASAKRSQAGSR